MTRTRMWLSLALLSGAPVMAAAQGTVQPSAAAQTAMYEDIEIMRRLLSRELQTHAQNWCSSCHGLPGRGFRFGGDDKTLSASFFAGAMSDWAHPAHAVDVDGTYLKGYGVVFHVTMPGLIGGQTEPARPGQASVSDWERIRKELRGEKTPQTEASPKRRVDEADLLLKLLADHGRNFSKLGDKENLSIVVNFRPAWDPHASHGVLWGLTADGTMQSVTARDPFKMTVKHPDSGGSKAPTGDSSGTGEFELLGDLQVKQGRVQEAIQAYQKAVAAQADRQRKAALYQKLAQAQLKLDEKSTSQALAKAIDYLNLAQQAAATTPAVPPRPPELLTSKLIVTAPKSLLDAAAKVISFEEFRKAAHVERITVAGETKRAAGDSKPGGPQSPRQP